jgi:hypothetical protein
MKLNTITRHSDTCWLVLSTSKKEVEAVVQSFTEHQNLSVIINKSVKLSMKWNGKVYEGRGAGMDFTSDGPAISKTQTGIRG